MANENTRRPKKPTRINPFSRFFKRGKNSQSELEKERDRVEKEYARTHQAIITVVEPETRHEMKLTRKGKYELGSDGKLTANGLKVRLKHRYNLSIIVLTLLIIAVYVVFFTVNF